jgi:predicted ATPase/class 3 adenylate cyclase
METTRIGPYRLEERLGAGGMGVVYRAYDERLDRWVAVKLLHPGGGETERERLRREARASARFDHPAIVRIFDLVEQEGSQAIVMELVEGASLAARIRQGTLGLEQALAISLEVAEALAEAHARGIVHRDLKTENVLVTPDGHAKVLDFGMAKQLDQGESSLTLEGMVIGTARSMSPEQAQGGEVDSRCDLFSFGVLLYEMFTGLSPFVAPTALATLGRVCNHLPPPARSLCSALPPELSELIDHLLEKRADRRPRDAREVALRLAAFAPALAPTVSLHAERTASFSPTGRTLPSPSTGGERRQLTFLSCGLVRPGGGPLDAEELLEATRELDGLVTAVVQRFGGSLKPGGSDGWQACFGHPRAHEDDALRAVTAALELAAGMESASVRPTIGIYTGSMIIARTAGSGDADPALGETPQIAMVLQRLASPGAVLVGAETSHLVSGFFRIEELPSVAVPWSPRSLPVHRVLGGSGARNRVHAAGSLTRLVGRDQELGLLQERWQLAREGRGQVILLTGEAGFGKSRLVWELRRRIGPDAGWLEGQASAFDRNSAFHPILQWIDQWIGAEQEDAPEIRKARFETALAAHRLPVEEIYPWLGDLLRLPQEECNAAFAPPPEVRRRKTIEALLRMLLAASERQPLLLVVEDLHWIDPSSLELLGQLEGHAASSSILLLVTFRPEARIQWKESSHLTRLNLGSLSRSQTSLLIEELTAKYELTVAVREQIAARTDGVPLFVEELTRMLLETGDSLEQTWRGIPSTLAGWLDARLDLLDSARQVAQLASAFGREVSDELLRAVAPWEGPVLDRELERLVKAEILYRQGIAPRCRYRFKHALLQDAAYASLLRSERQRHHRRIAEVLEECFPDTAVHHPELVAHHYTEAGLAEPALRFWQRAGEKALRSSAHAEAAAHLQRALDLLSRSPETPERDAQEVELQLGLGVAKAYSRSYAAPEIRQAYDRAWELCSRLGPTPRRFPVLRGLFVFYMVSGLMRSALEITEQMLELARADGSPVLLSGSCQAMGLTLLWMGEFERSRECLEQGQSLASSHENAGDPLLPGLGSLTLENRANLGTLLWFLGRPDAGIELLREALAEARELALHHIHALLLVCAADVLTWRGEPVEAGALAAEGVRLGADQGLAYFGCVAELHRSWSVAALSTGAEQEEAFQGMREAIARNLEMGGRAFLPSQCGFLAHSLLQAGRLTECAAALDTGFRISEEGEQHYATAELLRLRGELLLRQGAPPGEAEDVFREALGLARRQGAKSLELRAATSLARLWAGQGRRDEARDLLAGIYGWFTEGFATGDLCAARELLAAI